MQKIDARFLCLFWRGGARGGRVDLHCMGTESAKNIFLWSCSGLNGVCKPIERGV